MGNAGTPNGVGNKKSMENKKPAKVLEVPEEEINERIERFTAEKDPITGKIIEETVGEQTLYAGCGMFETTERNMVKADVDVTGSAGESGNGNIKMDSQIIQSLENVEKSGVYVQVHDKSKELESSKKTDKKKGSTAKEDRDDEELEQK